ncbi:hypothetical protein OSB04_007621 [Centaurea solstitialis]|uniref:Cytochrome P450 n=1 Tax=Centaurea solstitialis TaxID=347529 RepID=A0AA38WTD6_9ASTR|nr:hypothetical protein OSB04_007621 [Centaurea solstitialis]
MFIMFLLLLISSLSFSILIIYLFKPNLSSPKPCKNLPPSPPRLPIIGNMHQLGSSPHRALQAMAQSYGQLMLLHLGTIPVLIASSADVAREIMKTHDLIFSNRPKLSISDKLTYGSKDIAFSQYGEYWRQAKSIAVLHVLTNKRVQSYRQVRKDETSLLIKKIQESHESVVNLSELIMSLTNNVICRVALGRTYNGKKFKNLLLRFLELLGSFTVGSYIPFLKWVDRLSGLERRADEVAEEFNEFLEGVIEEHVNKKLVDTEGQDIVDILLEIQKNNRMGFRLERDEIKAIILDIFAGGTDTTFANLEWTISELLRHPRAMKKLQQEAREIGQGKSMITEDDLEKMPYLKSVLKETLRLHPPLPLLVHHESTEDVKLLGYDIKAGTRVIINASTIGRDSSTWTNPNEFQPERFLDNPIDYKGFHFELIPFGAGRRGCPAIQFAMIINEFVLANLVYKFDLKVAEGKDLDMSETNGLTVHRKYPLLVTATPYYKRERESERYRFGEVAAQPIRRSRRPCTMLGLSPPSLLANRAKSLLWFSDIISASSTHPRRVGLGTTQFVSPQDCVPADYIGNMHQLGSSPHLALQAMAQSYGHLMLLHLGTVPVLVASSADVAREIMKTQDLIFSNRPKISIIDKLTYGSKDIAFSQYGEYWRQAKSIAVLHVLTNKRVQSYQQVRKDETSLLIKKIQESHESVVNLSELMMSLTNNVICRVALGRTYDGKKFKNLLLRFVELLGSFTVGSYIPFLKWVDRLSGLERRADEVAEEFNEFLEGVIEEHVNKKLVDTEGQDIVDILLEIQKNNTMGFHLERDQIKAIIMNIFEGGTDTTFASLEWAISELLRHPRAMKKLQQEAREIGQGRSMITEDELEKMPYLKSVIKETLRLHPPLPLLVPHESTEDVKLLGYDITAGTRVIINAWAIGRDSSTWTDPNEFQPERFLDNSVDYKGFHFELIPFGAGRRGCPAIQFVMIINELVLANLVYKFDLKVAEGKDLDMSETYGLTVHKKCPLLVTATRYYE